MRSRIVLFYFILSSGFRARLGTTLQKTGEGSFLDSFLPSFKRHLSYGKFLKCLPYQWDEKRKKFIANQSLSTRNSIRLWALFTATYIAFLITNTIHGDHSLADKVVAGLVLEFYIICFAMGLEFGPDTAPIENLNRLLLNPGKIKYVPNVYVY